VSFAFVFSTHRNEEKDSKCETHFDMVVMAIIFIGVKTRFRRQQSEIQKILPTSTQPDDHSGGLAEVEK